MAKKKGIAHVTMKEEIKEQAKKQSKKVFGSVNLSGYLSYLVVNDEKNRD